MNLKHQSLSKISSIISNNDSVRRLLISNILVIFLALAIGYNLTELIWVYYLQNLIIGYFNFKRMKNLKSFSTAGFCSNGQLVPENEKGRDKTASFFLMHYGIFHLAYLGFLLSRLNLNLLTSLSIVISAIIFYFNHRYSYQINHEKDLAGRPNIGNLMFTPYLRVFPMHVICLLYTSPSPRDLSTSRMPSSA